MSAITAVQRGTNGQLIATAQALYPMDGRVLDMTPGSKLGFWKEVQPAGLEYLVGADFRSTHLQAGAYDHVVLDPPYVAPGGRETSTTGEMNERFGMHDTERTPWGQWNTQIVPGVVEAHRLLRKGGLLWMKCMSYVSSGEMHWFSKEALPMLRGVGFDLIDEFILDGHTGPQPLTDKCKACDGTGHGGLDDMGLGLACPKCKGAGSTPRRQVHARQAHSFLMIAKKRRAA